MIHQDFTMSGTASKIPQSVIDYQLSHADDTRQPGLYAFYIIMLTASIFVVVARFASRKVGPGLGLDDWCVGLALIFLCGVFVCNFMYLAAGLGKHQLTVSESQQAFGAKVCQEIPFLSDCMHLQSTPDWFSSQYTLHHHLASHQNLHPPPLPTHLLRQPALHPGR